jgi:proteasome lid subunit RPN8/RPN11
MISVLVLSGPLRAQIMKEARNAFPRECCGLVEGTRSGSTAYATALHATRNLAIEVNRFEVDAAIHFALLHRLRGTERTIIGCYHSHPNGKSEPSELDCAAAAEEGFLWLISACRGQHREESRIAAFVSKGHAFRPVRIVVPSLDRLTATPV